MSVFDQRGQKVDKQTNIAGDVVQSKSGDTINMSGDFRGAMVNVKSTLSNVTQTINASSADPSLKDELNQLIEQLTEALKEVPEEKAEEAEAVAQMSMLSPGTIQIFGESLSAMVSGFDALWIILAVGTAWGIPKAGQPKHD